MSEHQRPDKGIESNTDPKARIIRRLFFIGLPTLVASVVVLLLGLPPIIVVGFLVLYVIAVLVNS